jgi:hypothetical protein
MRIAPLLATAAAGLAFAGHAGATTVGGTFTYQDSDARGALLARPITGVPVEVWRTGFLGIWYRATTATTDASGSIRVSVPFTKNARYAVRVVARNEAAYTGAWTDPGSKVARTPTDSLDFTTAFTGLAAARFNAIETVRHGYQYARSHRDPRERDPIGPVGIGIGSITGISFYDPTADTIRLMPADLTNDAAILHEYAHFLEEQISSFAWIPSYHDGCIAKDIFGNTMKSPEHAWMEGFADYFSGVVRTLDPFGFTDAGGTPTPWALETPSCSFGHGGETVENDVAGSLWDLFDSVTDPGARPESFDSLSRYDRQVFEIFDHELDTYGHWPTPRDFRDAWMARGLPAAEFDSIRQAYGF